MGEREAVKVYQALAEGFVDEGTRHVFTLMGAEHAYRVLIESMNEGALTLTADEMILYANQCFARMVKSPLEQVIGSSFRRFLSAENRAALRPLMKRSDKSGAKIQVRLRSGDGSQVPAQISIRPLAKAGLNPASIGMVVTDMTEALRNEELLRNLTHRLMKAQEVERGNVALELHDHITQLLCAVRFRSQVLADGLSARDGASKKEAIRLREMLGKTAVEVERISRNLRPGILDQLGLVAVLDSTRVEFEDRTGVSVTLASVPLTARLPAGTELALYRILQEALKNVEKHARARHVIISLTQQAAFIQLAIHDDGIGFDVDHRPARRKKTRGLGLLGMRERANYVGGALKVKSTRRAGTEIEVRIPCRPGPPQRSEIGCSLDGGDALKLARP